VIPGETYILEVDGPSFLSMEKLGAWVDWNGDFLFGGPDSGERFDYTGDENGPFQIDIQVPVDAPPGEKRMRIRRQYVDYILPCWQGMYGEAEDYTVVVMPVTPAPTHTPTPDPPTHTPTIPPTSTPECMHHGDVNFSGTLTAADAQMAFSIVLGTLIPTYEEECAADCDASGNVTAGDAQRIFFSVLGMMGGCEDPL
jgi:hypothetical protein